MCDLRWVTEYPGLRTFPHKGREAVRVEGSLAVYRLPFPLAPLVLERLIRSTNRTPTIAREGSWIFLLEEDDGLLDPVAAKELEYAQAYREAEGVCLILPRLVREPDHAPWWVCPPDCGRLMCPVGEFVSTTREVWRLRTLGRR